MFGDMAIQQWIPEQRQDVSTTRFTGTVALLFYENSFFHKLIIPMQTLFSVHNNIIICDPAMREGLSRRLCKNYL